MIKTLCLWTGLLCPATNVVDPNDGRIIRFEDHGVVAEISIPDGATHVCMDDYSYGSSLYLSFGPQGYPHKQKRNNYELGINRSHVQFGYVIDDKIEYKLLDISPVKIYTDAYFIDPRKAPDHAPMDWKILDDGRIAYYEREYCFDQKITNLKCEAQKRYSGSCIIAGQSSLVYSKNRDTIK